ncbi:MAG: CDP-alcohol phosphatidyltransferase family protein [Proteobacteria bacterium]|nr:CDP-alcohol phosphatidyltransferase family protein [Pseudomonadota bacterium]
MTRAVNGAPKPGQRTLAWGVHLFTASGAVVGTLALLTISAGELHKAAILILVALFIDSVDGTLARRVGVATVLPSIDGRRLDDVVDFLNYAIVPAVFWVAAGSLLHWVWAVPPILASAYGFSQQDAKTEDDFFLGFPSYWNVVALYLWLLEIGPVAGTLWVSALTIGVFIPLKYVYPSKLRVLRKTTNGLGMLWGLCVSLAVIWPDWADRYWLVELSLAYPAYYLALSWKLGGFQRAAAEP